MMELTASVTRLWQRIPKAVLFGVAVLLQCALLVLMVADRMQILREGRPGAPVYRLPAGLEIASGGLQKEACLRAAGGLD